MRPRLLLTINCKFAVDFFGRGLHTRTAVARLPLRQLGFLVEIWRHIGRKSPKNSEYSEITNQTLHNFFVNSSNVSVMNVSCHDIPMAWDLANSVTIRFFSNETRAFLLDPVLGKSCCVSRCAIFQQDAPSCWKMKLSLRQEMPAVFD